MLQNTTECAGPADSASGGRTGRKRLWTVIKTLLAVGLLAFVVSRTSWYDFVEMLHRIRPGWLLAGFVAYVGLLWFQARRGWLLIDRQVPFALFVNVTIVQNAVSSFVASGAGVATYVGLLKTDHQVSMKASIFSLLLSRVTDLAVTGAALALSAAMVWPQIAALHKLTLVLAAGIAAGVVVFGLIVALRRRMAALAGRLCEVGRWRQSRIAGQIRTLVMDAADFETRAVLRLVGLSSVYALGLCALTFLWAWCNVCAFRVPITYGPLIFMVALTQLMSIVPIQVFGGLGVYEVTSLFLYGLFGITQVQIAPVLVGSRVVFYLLNGILLAVVPILAWNHRQRTGPSGGAAQP